MEKLMKKLLIALLCVTSLSLASDDNKATNTDTITFTGEPLADGSYEVKTMTKDPSNNWITSVKKHSKDGSCISTETHPATSQEIEMAQRYSVIGSSLMIGCHRVADNVSGMRNGFSGFSNNFNGLFKNFNRNFKSFGTKFDAIKSSLGQDKNYRLINNQWVVQEEKKNTNWVSGFWRPVNISSRPATQTEIQAINKFFPLATAIKLSKDGYSQTSNFSRKVSS
jgi:type 1 fimbria pilin